MILGAAPQQPQGYSEHSKEELLRVLSRLAQAGLLSSQADVILRTMHDGLLLSAATALQGSTEGREVARRLTPADDARQIRRTLPLVPHRAYLALLAALAAAGAGLWVWAQLWRLPGLPPRPPIPGKRL
jgi:hypothetical protein